MYQFDLVIHNAFSRGDGHKTEFQTKKALEAYKTPRDGKKPVLPKLIIRAKSK